MKLTPDQAAWFWSLVAAGGMVLLVLMWQACGCGRVTL